MAFADVGFEVGVNAVDVAVGAAVDVADDDSRAPVFGLTAGAGEIPASPQTSQPDRHSDTRSLPNSPRPGKPAALLSHGFGGDTDEAISSPPMHASNGNHKHRKSPIHVAVRPEKPAPLFSIP